MVTTPSQGSAPSCTPVSSMLAESHCPLLQGCWLLLSELSLHAHPSPGSVATQTHTVPRWSSVNSFWSRWGGGVRTGAQMISPCFGPCLVGLMPKTAPHPFWALGPFPIVYHGCEGKNPVDNVGGTGCWGWCIAMPSLRPL